MGAGSDREWVPCSATERGRSDPRSGTSRDGVVREGEVGWRESNPSAERRLKRRESNNNNKKRRKPKTTSYYKMTDLVCECRSSCDENDPRHTVRVSPPPPLSLDNGGEIPKPLSFMEPSLCRVSSRRGLGGGGSQDPEHQSQPFVDPYPLVEHLPPSTAIRCCGIGRFLSFFN